MPSISQKRRRSEGKSGRDGPKRKKSKRQTTYHSSSEDEDEAEIRQVGRASDAPAPITRTVIGAEPATKDDTNAQAELELGEDSDDNDDEVEEEEEEEANASGSSSEPQSDGSISSTESGPDGPKRKRNDPTAFATSMSKILGSKLTTSKRTDPVLSRSKDASAAVKEMSEARLEAKAKQKLKDQKLAKLDTGRVKDVLGLEDPEVSTEQIQEVEKKLRKIAQRGVVKLFNAVRAAQVKGEEAAREARMTGVVGMDRREEKVNEMSKKGFLDLIAGGGKK
jgi:mitochondrial fusion and transport protein UGO1